MKKKLLIVLAVVLVLTLLLTSLTFAHVGHKTIEYPGWYKKVSNYLDMYYACVSDCCCGPSSGTSIGWYYKTRPLEFYDNNYQYLPSSKTKMYNALYEYMDTGIFGATNPYNYGPGFVEMALHYGYDNFSYVHYGPESDEKPATAAFFDEKITKAIDNGWPVALFAIQALKGFEGVDAISTDEPQPPIDWPCELRHVIAIEGYSYTQGFWPPGLPHPFNNRRIRCTDSDSKANTLWLSWDDVIDEVGEDYLHAVIIKDVDEDTPDGPAVEDFEWGDDEDSLEDWQDNGGEVDWTVSTSGSSVAEIDDDVETRPGGTGTRSARIYRNDSNIYAFYSLLRPSSIGFYLKKGDTAYAAIANGDGSHAISVDITDAEELRYYDTSYHTVRTLLPDTWYHIEFRNIDWDEDFTYDIYVDGDGPWQASMRSGTGYQKYLYFISWVAPGEVWVDDITDSLRPL